MRPATVDRPPGGILLGIAGIPANEEEKKYVRQASLLLRYRIWLRGVVPADASDL